MANLQLSNWLDQFNKALVTYLYATQSLKKVLRGTEISGGGGGTYRVDAKKAKEARERMNTASSAILSLRSTLVGILQLVNPSNAVIALKDFDTIFAKLGSNNPSKFFAPWITKYINPLI
jgi:hypothetical protein